MSYPSAVRPGWVSDDLFPFESKFFTTPSGHTMHYIDEGEGRAIVFVHGNPTWSFEFRHPVRDLRTQYRCIAFDHIGFGLSSRSSRREDFHPKFHADNFTALLDYLGVDDITLFLTDWGGPIALDFTRKNPARVKALVLANTWCWPVSRDFHFVFFSSVMASPLGQFLIRRRNFFVNRVMPRAMGRKSALTPEVIAHYRNAQPSGQRGACAAFPGHITGATDWLRSIWTERSAFTDKPTLLLWGLKDIAFRRKELELWKHNLSNFATREFNDCGHFLAEETPAEVSSALKAFLART